VSPERARAVIHVEPNHAACYWRAISATLTRLGPERAHLEINVVDVAHSPGAPESQLVVLEMSSADLDQATLESAMRETHLTCRGDMHAPVPAIPTGMGVTVSWPLIMPPDQTIEAPIRPAPEPRDS
jgi:hypothetical protein